MKTPKLVIFDMDGTLIDSEGAIGRASKEALTEWGISPELKDFLEFTGQGDDKFVGGVARKYGLEYKREMKDRAYEIYMAHPERIEVFPWSLSAVRGVLDRGISAAIASASDRVKVHFNLRRVGVSPEEFSAVISASDVTRQKPDPEIFLLAAARAGIDPCDCLVCEDSTSGVKAGKAAGMTVVGITTGYSRDELIAAGADIVADDLREIFEKIDF